MAGRKKQNSGKESASKQTYDRGVKAKAKVYVVIHGRNGVNQARAQLQRQQSQRAESTVHQLVTLFTADRRDPNIVRRK